MPKLIKNRAKEWESKNLIMNILSEIKAIYKLREVVGNSELFHSLVDFVFDQFPFAERDTKDGRGTEEWWKATLQLEKDFYDIPLEKLYELVTRPLNIKKEET